MFIRCASVERSSHANYDPGLHGHVVSPRIVTCREPRVIRRGQYHSWNLMLGAFGQVVGDAMLHTLDGC